MNAEEIQNERNNLEKMLEMTHTEGWDLYVKQMQDAFDQRNQVLAIPDTDSFLRVQGSLAVLKTAIDFQETVIGSLDYLENLDPDDGLDLDLDIADEQL